MKIAVLPGDGIGKEIISETLKVLGRLGLKFEFEEAPVGGAGYEASGHPLPEKTLALAKSADANLFGWNRPSARSRPSSACARSWACSPTCVRRRCTRNSLLLRRCGRKSSRASTSSSCAS